MEFDFRRSAHSTLRETMKSQSIDIHVVHVLVSVCHIYTSTMAMALESCLSCSPAIVLNPRGDGATADHALLTLRAQPQASQEIAHSNHNAARASQQAWLSP